jgi:hypothetical protein
MLTRDGEDSALRVMEFFEFRRKMQADEHFRAGMAPLVNLLQGFHPSKRAVVRRILLYQATAAIVLGGLSMVMDADNEEEKRMEDLVWGPEGQVTSKPQEQLKVDLEVVDALLLKDIQNSMSKETRVALRTKTSRRLLRRLQ